MEKTFGQDVIVFKTEINMRDRQKISKSVRERQESKDEMQMTFDIFPVWVVSINGQTDLTDDQKKEWIENLTDLQLFKEVAEVLGELQTTAGGIDEKKKDKFTYEFDKIANTGKTNLNDPELLEILFIDKFHRTHEEFMNTPKEIVDLLLLKWGSDAKAEKKKSKSLSIKK